MTISSEQIARVRAFNRDYTRRIGVLAEGLLDSPYSLTEVRVMYEIAHRRDATAAELADELHLDRGYLSRLLKGFEAKKLLARTASPEDGRRQHLRLTPVGKRVFAPLERRSREQVKGMLSALDEARRGAVLQAMEVIQSAFDGNRQIEATEADAPARCSVAGNGGKEAPTRGARIGRGGVAVSPAPGAALAGNSGVGVSPTHGAALSPIRDAGVSPAPGAALSPAPGAAPVSLRGHRPGDMGWVVQRHGELYHQEYGWNEEFEALVAGIVAEFVRKLDPARERCWIAERAGHRLGCIFLVAKDATTAKLRLLLVEPQARGLGVGRTLVRECLRFAREAGFRKVLLWTQENLAAARHIYTEAGFERIAQEPHHSFGYDLVGETWALELRAGRV